MTTDKPCTQEDRDKIVAAARKRAATLLSLADKLDAFDCEDYDFGYIFEAAAQLRQLIE